MTGARRAHIARTHQHRFDAYVLDDGQAGEARFEPNRVFDDVDQAIAWARSQAPQVVVRFGAFESTTFSAGADEFDGYRLEAPLRHWPPSHDELHAMDEEARRVFAQQWPPPGPDRLDDADGAESLRIAERGVILRVPVGSTVHGLHLEAQDDRDEMAVVVEPESHVLGFGQWEHHVERTQPEGARSGPGDLDLVYYGLRKFCRLALAGNPTVLLLLFAPDPIVETPLGRELRELAPAFVSRAAGDRYLGYLRSQKERLLGTGHGGTSRPELIEAHGFDTKYAMHVLRLAAQGRELMETGRLTLPLPEPERSRILAVRRGELGLTEVVSLVERAERELISACERSSLPLQGAAAEVEAWMIHAYEQTWGLDRRG
jgi:predicted nucleotidyltransferase